MPVSNASVRPISIDPPCNTSRDRSRTVRASSLLDDTVLDFFAECGTTGGVAAELGRAFTLIDSADDAITTIRCRLEEGVPSVSFEITGIPTSQADAND